MALVAVKSEDVEKIKATENNDYAYTVLEQMALKLQENENRDGECICCGRCRVVCPKGNIKRNKVK